MFGLPDAKLVKEAFSQYQTWKNKLQISSDPHIQNIEQFISSLAGSFPKQSVKLGKHPARIDSRTLKLSKYLGDLPAPPASVVNSRHIRDWGMMGNDQLGDCLVEGTFTVAPGILKSYRSLYDGPVVSIKTGTGKTLTSTRNHQMLTSRGFLPAHLINKEDQVISCDFPQAIAGRIDNNFKNVPSRIEDIFESNERVALPGGIKRKVCAPVDFHGDARFFKGDVNIVNSNSLLKRSNMITFGHPERQESLVAAIGDSVTFNSFRPSFSALNTILPSTLCFMGSYRPSTSLLNRISRGSKLARFFHRPNLYASPAKKSVNNFPTDPELVGEFIGAFPGQVQFDKVIGVETKGFCGHVYDLSTEREWYISNGIITHNCTCAAVAHAHQAWVLSQVNAGIKAGIIMPSLDAVVGIYERWCGYNPDDPSTDRGGEELSVLNHWRQDGFEGRKILAYASIDPANTDHVKQAIYLFGCVYIGVQLPDGWQNAKLWDANMGDPGSWGGHAVVCPDFYIDQIPPITWGMSQPMTWPGFSQYCDECYAIIAEDWQPPLGFDLATLKQDLTAITG